MQNRISLLSRIKSSAKELKNTKSIVLCGLLIALYIAAYSLAIQITPTLRLSVSFIALALLAYRFGPVTASLAAISCDVLGFFLRPQQYPFHPGFTITAVLSTLVFALFYYKCEIKLWRIIVSKLIVNIAFNTILNSFWMKHLSGQAHLYYLWEHGSKNVLFLPIEIILLWIFLNTFKKIDKHL